jgi:hypothetical protein
MGAQKESYGKLQDIFFQMKPNIIRQEWPQERLLGGSCGHRTNGYTHADRLIALLSIFGKEASANILLAHGILFQGLDTQEGRVRILRNAL